MKPVDYAKMWKDGVTDDQIVDVASMQEKDYLGLQNYAVRAVVDGKKPYPDLVAGIPSYATEDQLRVILYKGPFDLGDDGMIGVQTKAYPTVKARLAVEDAIIGIVKENDINRVDLVQRLKDFSTGHIADALEMLQTRQEVKVTVVISKM